MVWFAPSSRPGEARAALLSGIHAASFDRGGRRRRGATLVEVLVVFTILVVAASLFSRMVIAVSQMRNLNRENSTAAEGARVIIEQMRNRNFEDVYRLYNLDPADDPGGPGTAPGNLFQVAGLTPIPGSGGLHLEVILPGYPPDTESQLGGTKWDRTGEVALVGVAPEPEPEPEPGDDWYQVREDYQDASLGMPRDLNGDNIIDAEPHTEDYILLPVLVRVEWQGRLGPRRYEIHTMLAEFKDG